MGSYLIYQSRHSLSIFSCVYLTLILRAKGADMNWKKTCFFLSMISTMVLGNSICFDNGGLRSIKIGDHKQDEHHLKEQKNRSSFQELGSIFIS